MGSYKQNVFTLLLCAPTTLLALDLDVPTAQPGAKDDFRQCLNRTPETIKTFIPDYKDSITKNEEHVQATIPKMIEETMVDIKDGMAKANNVKDHLGDKSKALATNSLDKNSKISLRSHSKWSSERFASAIPKSESVIKESQDSQKYAKLSEDFNKKCVDILHARIEEIERQRGKVDDVRDSMRVVAAGIGITRSEQLKQMLGKKLTLFGNKYFGFENTSAALNKVNFLTSNGFQIGSLLAVDRVVQDALDTFRSDYEQDDETKKGEQLVQEQRLMYNSILAFNIAWKTKRFIAKKTAAAESRAIASGGDPFAVAEAATAVKVEIAQTNTSTLPAVNKSILAIIAAHLRFEEEIKDIYNLLDQDIAEANSSLTNFNSDINRFPNIESIATGHEANGEMMKTASKTGSEVELKHNYDFSQIENTKTSNWANPGKKKTIKKVILDKVLSRELGSNSSLKGANTIQTFKVMGFSVFGI